MDCPHVKQCNQRVPAHLEPFVCAVCKSEDSPWLCVDCGAVHCGRYIQGHAKAHYEQAKHCISVDCHNLGAFCYACDDYIANQHAIPRRLFDRLNAHHSNFEGSECEESSKSSSSSSDVSGANDEDPDLSMSSSSTEKSPINRSGVGLENKNPKSIGRRNRRTVESNRNNKKVNTSEKSFPENLRKRNRVSGSTKSDIIRNDLNNSSSEKKPKLIDERVCVRENRSPHNDSKSKDKSFDGLNRSVVETRGSKTKENHESVNNIQTNVVGIGAALNGTKNMKHGVVGLRNLGNSCFMNSVLQSLSKIRGFTCYMADIPPPDQLRLNETHVGANGSLPKPFTYSTRSRKNGLLSSKNSPLNHISSTATSISNNIGKGTNGVPNSQNPESLDAKKDFRTEEFLTDELRKILISLNTTGSSAVSPDALFAIIWEVMPRFRGYQQQDAHEFLRYMLDRLHTELLLLVPKFSWSGNGVGIPHKSSLSNIIGSSNKLEGIVSASFSLHGRNSIVTSVFGGTLQNEVRCSSCGMESKKHDPFLDLSLDIPCFSGDSKLEDCLSRFVDIEELVDNDMYFCSNCKIRQKSTKRFWIRRLPNVLCLHLKRFRWSNYLRTKLDQYVQFPLTSLDMTSYLLKNIHGTRGSSGSNLYDLAAVIVHHGSGVGSGHYTAFAKKDSQWYHFNDSIVKPIDESMVAKCKAYILFYTRREFKL